MKKIAVLGGMAIALGVGGWAYLMSPTITEVVNSEPEVVKEIVVEDALDVRIKKAQEEARSDIETKLEAYRQELLTEVADEVKVEYIAEVEASISDESY